MKRLGEAQDRQERMIEQVILSYPPWQGKRAHYTPVSGGISNANWRVDIEGCDRPFFVKIPGLGSDMFVHRHTAHEASLKAAQTGYGVPVVGFLPHLGVEIFEFIEGWRASVNQDFLQSDIRHTALRALKSFNQQSPLTQTKTAFDMIEEHDQQIRDIGGQRPRDHLWLSLQYRRVKQALMSAGIDTVPCMNDTLAGNFMLNPHGDIRLVDFEYASNNDRYYELALWFGEMFFSPEIEQELLEDYFGQVNPQIVARIQLNKFLADLKWSSWAIVQHQLAQIEFDFSKYGNWKQMRARSLLHHSDWERWLKRV